MKKPAPTAPTILISYQDRIDLPGLMPVGKAAFPTVVRQARAVSDTPWGQVDFAEWFDAPMTTAQKKLFAEMAEQALFRFLVNAINRRQIKRHLKRRLKWVN
jgi:hypothetical protein